MNFLTILLAAAGLVVTRAQTHSFPEMDSSALRALCISVKDRELDLNEQSPFTFEYEKALWKLAGASAADDVDMARMKVQEFWNTHRGDLVCETNGVQESLLRFAVRNDFLEIVEDLAENYDVDIDTPDASDGRTLMEFIAAELMSTKASQATASYNRLEAFYDYMKKTAR